MSWLGIIVLAALMVPVVAIVADSPIGRALARRLEGSGDQGPALAELTRRVDQLEGELEDLQRNLGELREENAFLQRLLEDQSARRNLPPPAAP